MSHAAFPSHAIAIVGMAGRFPKSPTLDEFWRNIRDGVECLTRFSDEELAAAGVPEEIRRQPQYVPVRGVLEDADRFDATFFGINPREAELVDPQQRLLLECAVEAFEDAGYDWTRTSVPVGVFTGVGANSYVHTQIARADLSGHPGAAYEVFIGNDKDFCATRLSYKLGLRGPGVNVQTACSTSLVAVHMACQSLLTFQCDMALAGAASLLPGRAGGYLYAEGMILSPDGHCRPFDADARGTVPSEAVGLVLLKRLDDALVDGDNIRAVILGTAVNNDGAGKAGFTAPSIDGQREAIGLALAMADVPPESVGYIETHGTATPLGNPIEIAALTQAYRERTDASGFCALSALKGNIGHTDTVAGVAGLIKAVLALEHREIPPTLHHQSANPALSIDSSPFFVNAELRSWEQTATPRRAGVSSFGIGGTNAHAVLQEAPAVPSRAVSSTGPRVLTVSARSEAALDAATRRLGDALRMRPGLSIGDVAFTLQQGRREHRYRRTIQCHTREQAVAAIGAGDPERVRIGRAGERRPAVMFMLSGQGAQYPGMGAGLYAAEPVFRDAIDECAEALRGVRVEDLRDVMLRGSGDEPADRLRQTFWAQPALFAIDYALARLWMARGVDPSGMIGHSLGEYVAAALAGVFAPADAMRLVAERARLMDALPGGAMTAVSLPEQDLVPLLPSDVSVAAVNGPSLVVASGPTAAIESLERALAARGAKTRRLHTSHAFHSAMVEPMLGPFRAALAGVRMSPPDRRYVSNVTGTWIDASEATSPEYWLRHVRQAVRFGDGVALLAGEGDALFLEVGPGRTLATLARQQLGPSGLVVTSLRHADEQEDDTTTFTAATATLWRHGASVDWSALHGGEEPRRVALPTYPFERERHWIEPAASIPSAQATVTDPRLLPKLADVSEWLWQPSWVRAVPRTVRADSAVAVCLVLADDDPLADQLLERLTEAGSRVVVVRPGDRFQAAGDTYRVRPGSFGDFESLGAGLAAQGVVPGSVVSLWGLSRLDGDVETVLDRTYHSAVALVQQLHEHIPGPRHLHFVARGVHDVMAGDEVRPLAATLIGPVRVIPQEYAGTGCTLLDVGSADADGWLEMLVAEILDPDTEPLVAYRAGRRWVHRMVPAPVPAPAGLPRALRPRGTYLMTGAFGGMGLVIARDLAERLKANLILTSRAGLPQREDWDRVLESDPESKAARAIGVVRELEASGAEVLASAADVADSVLMRGLVDEARSRFGRIDGVIHAAGVSGGGVLQYADRASAAATLRPKVDGTLVLAQVLADDPPDWLVLCSSVNSIFVAGGGADYCAANAFLDAYAQSHDGRGATRVIAIAWDTWQETGMAVDLQLPAAFQAQKRLNLRHGMTNAEGLDVLYRVMSRPSANVLAVTQGYDRIVRTITAAFEARHGTAREADEHISVAATDATSTAGAHSRPDLSVPFVAPRDEVETQMARIWEELLGISGIGVHDNFFELGGHSLLGTQLISRLRDQFSVQLPLRTIFEASTIEALGRQVSGMQWAGGAGMSTDLAGEDREEVEL